MQPAFGYRDVFNKTNVFERKHLDDKQNFNIENVQAKNELLDSDFKKMILRQCKTINQIKFSQEQQKVSLDENLPNKTKINSFNELLSSH